MLFFRLKEGWDEPGPNLPRHGCYQLRRRNFSRLLPAFRFRLSGWLTRSAARNLALRERGFL